MNFKEFSQRCFRYFTGAPSNAFTNISTNNGQFTSKVSLQLNIPFEEVFKRVHESNMSKLVDGKPLKRADGKFLKGPNYKKPDLSDLY